MPRIVRAAASAVLTGGPPRRTRNPGADLECRAKGWPEKQSVTRRQSRGGDFDYDDPFITDKQPIDITPEDLRAKLQMVPNAEDHDIWFQIGMALDHTIGSNLRAHCA